MNQTNMSRKAGIKKRRTHKINCYTALYHSEFEIDM
jgi:hypothetical protein